MRETRPFFSVLMPTYNRAHLLPLAMESVLSQTFGDLELVVSNGGSTDNTAEVVASFNDPRINYIESPKRLSIGDNYQQAYDNARGEYITFLSDDDAFVPGMLDRIHGFIERELIEIIVFRSCFYFQDAVHRYGYRLPENSVFILPYTGNVTPFAGKVAARAVFGASGLGGEVLPHFNVSFLANAVYRRSVLEAIYAVNPRMFATTPADGYLAAAVAFVVNQYHCLDEPLHVWTNWEENASASPERLKKGIRKHYERLLNGETLDGVPAKFAMPANCFANALIQAERQFDNEGSVSVDWFRYYVLVYEELNYLRTLDADVGEEMAELTAALAGEPPELQARVTEYIVASRRTIKNRLYRLSPALFRALKRIPAFRKRESGQIFFGSEMNFKNVLECGQFVGQRLDAGRQ